MKLAGLNYPTSLNETEKYNYVGDLAIHIQRLATAVAQSVYWQATGSAAPQNCTTSNVTVIAAVIEIYWKSVVIATELWLLQSLTL